ncbi:MAG: helix-turn-helix transcriptional regulator [Chitinophagaceae bacterium]
MKETIGKRIRKIRESKDYSQENVAGELNMTTSAYSKIERGITDAPTSKLVRIAEILEVDIADFFIDINKDPGKFKERNQAYGFATKGDIEEIVKMINELAKKVGQIEAAVNPTSTNTAKKKATRK